MALLCDQAVGSCVLARPIFGELVVKFRREHILLLPSKGLWGGGES